MKRIILLLKWISRAWPVLIVLALIVIQILIYSYVNIDQVLMNNIIGQVLPLIGGVFVIISINENIQDFRKINIFSLFKNYLKSCPLIKHNYVLDVSSITVSTTFGKPTLFVKRPWNTAKEGIKELERRIEELTNYLADIRKKTEEDLTKLRSELNTLIDNNDKEIKEVSHLLDKSVMGNIDIQFFGILLIVYGSVINFTQIFLTK